MLLKKENREGLNEPFDLSASEKISLLRGSDVLSSDVVFLCALNKLQGKAKKFVFGVETEEEILARLSEIDANIYDFVIFEVEKIRLALEEKIRKAKELRDWKPAEKLMEPEQLALAFFDTVEKKVTEKCVELKIPKFFGSSDLKLSIHLAGEIWYVHDQGTALRHLKKRLANSEKVNTVLKKVCYAGYVDQGRVAGNFTSGYRFFLYLQKLVFVAHADLYYTRAEKQLYPKDRDEIYVPIERAEKLNANQLFDLLKQSISFSYDERRGITVCPQTHFSLFSTRPCFLIETKSEGAIVLSDARKGAVEGEIFEAFYWEHEDLSAYSKFIETFCNRFGAEFFNGGICLKEKKEKYFSALCAFFNLAVLLSELGHDIALPKLRKQERI